MEHVHLGTNDVENTTMDAVLLQSFLVSSTISLTLLFNGHCIRFSEMKWRQTLRSDFARTSKHVHDLVLSQSIVLSIPPLHTTYMQLCVSLTFEYDFNEKLFHKIAIFDLHSRRRNHNLESVLYFSDLNMNFEALVTSCLRELYVLSNPTRTVRRISHIDKAGWSISIASKIQVTVSEFGEPSGHCSTYFPPVGWIVSPSL